MKKGTLDTSQFSDKPDLAPALSSTSRLMPGEIIIGALAGLDSKGQPLADFSENTSGQPLVAITTPPLEQQHTGRQVALFFVKRNASPGGDRADSQPTGGYAGELC